MIFALEILLVVGFWVKYFQTLDLLFKKLKYRLTETIKVAEKVYSKVNNNTDQKEIRCQK